MRARLFSAFFGGETHTGPPVSDADVVPSLCESSFSSWGAAAHYYAWIHSADAYYWSTRGKLYIHLLHSICRSEVRIRRSSWKPSVLFKDILLRILAFAIRELHKWRYLLLTEILNWIFVTLRKDYIHHLPVHRLTACPYTSVSSVTAGLTVPPRDTGLASVCVVTASWCLPCEWCQRHGGVWYRTASDRADRTASRGPAPSEWPGTGWHPSAPSPGIWRSRTNGFHERRVQCRLLKERTETLHI